MPLSLVSCHTSRRACACAERLMSVAVCWVRRVATDAVAVVVTGGGGIGWFSGLGSGLGLYMAALLL